jgi:multidrug transporter EmrE-like cation transporter
MFQAHSFLWNYLWVAPNFLLLILALFLWRRDLRKQCPVFFAYAILAALGQLTIYAADVVPAIGPVAWWRIFWVALLLEGIVKFALVGEILAQALNSYSAVAGLAKALVRGVGVALILVAALVAAFAPQDGRFGIISGSHFLQQTIYLIVTGLLVFVFAFTAYFRFQLSRAVFGIALGLTVSSCVHLATWAIAANAGLPNSKRVILDFLNMMTYHAVVLMWFYYLLVPGKVESKALEAAAPLPENNLELWNRELERLIHQ